MGIDWESFGGLVGWLHWSVEEAIEWNLENNVLLPRVQPVEVRVQEINR